MQAGEAWASEISVHYQFVSAEASVEVELDASKLEYREILQIQQMIEILAQVMESRL